MSRFLGDVAEIVMGQSPAGDRVSEAEIGLPLLNGPTEFGHSHPHPKQYTDDARKRAQPADVLFCVRGSTTGRMNWADRDYAIGRGIAAIRHRSNVALQPLVRAVIEYALPGLLRQATGSTFPNVSGSQIGEIPFPDLPDDDLKASASVLGALDDRIGLNRNMSATLEAMTAALFRSWFVDFDPVHARANGKAMGLAPKVLALFPSAFEQSRSRQIPAGWKIRAIKDLASSIQYGLTTSATKSRLGPRFLRITDIQGGNVDWSTVPFCVTSPEAHERYRIHTGDVLVARTGASTGENLYIADAPDAVFASYLVRFQFKNRSLGRYVGSFMRTSQYFDYVAGVIGGSAQPNASAQALAGAGTIVPTDDILDAYFDTVSSVDVRRFANQSQTTTLIALRDALIPKLISGELRVSDAERILEKSA